MSGVAAVPPRLAAGAKLAVHLVGIGGTGMRGLATILRGMGMAVTGSDRDGLPADLAARLAAAGIRTFAGHAADHLPADAGLVVASAAIREENPEWREAARRGIPVLKYAEAVAEVVRAKRLVAVAGSHGKTTTSSIIAWILKRSGVSDAFLVGGQIQGIGESGWWGGGGHFVLEACEYDRSFLHYDPFVAVVTNVDADHMDYYKTMEALKEAFAAFVARVGPEGRVILCADDAPSAFLAESARAAAWTAGFSASADWRVLAHALSPEGSAFRLAGPDGHAEEFRTALCGLHNIRNAAQAVAAAAACGAPVPAIREALASFRGAERRMHLLGTVGGSPVIDDYGHHPAELAATFAAVRQRYPGRRLRVAFQPHQYARTEYLFDDFVRVLAEGPDDLLLGPVYGARHDGTAPKADSAALAAAIARTGKACRLETLDGMVEALGQAARPGDVILVIGAGDIGRVGHDLVRRYGAVEGA